MKYGCSTQVYSDARRVHSDDPWLTRAELIDVAPDLCNEYREAFNGEGYGPRRPAETFVSRPCCDGRWRRPSVRRKQARPLSVYDSQKEAIDLGSWSDGEPSAMITWYHRSPSFSEEAWKMIGFLHLDEGRLAADIPTHALADRLVGEVAARLGANATLIEMRPSVAVEVSSADTSNAGNPRASIQMRLGCRPTL